MYDPLYARRSARQFIVGEIYFVARYAANTIFGDLP